eukprot:COSAG01_NODE_694_length_14205_cov_228.163122_11_plen_306_part_00
MGAGGDETARKLSLRGSPPAPSRTSSTSPGRRAPRSPATSLLFGGHEPEPESEGSDQEESSSEEGRQMPPRSATPVQARRRSPSPGSRDQLFLRPSAEQELIRQEVMQIRRQSVSPRSPGGGDHAWHDVEEMEEEEEEEEEEEQEQQQQQQQQQHSAQLSAAGSRDSLSPSHSARSVRSRASAMAAEERRSDYEDNEEEEAAAAVDRNYIGGEDDIEADIRPGPARTSPSGRRVAASAGGAKNGGWVGADKLALWAAICANCTLAAVQLLVMLCNGLGVGLLHRRDVGLAFLCAWVSACTRLLAS